MTSRRTRLLAALIAALSLGLSLAVTSAPAHAASHRTAARVGIAAATYDKEAFGATNQRRTAHHLSSLKQKPCLQRFAQRQANWMAKHHSLQHQQLPPIQKACHVGYVGENIAFGFADGGAVVTAWMHSPGHRANILFPRFQRMGLAATKRHGVWWVSQVFSSAH